MTFTQDQIQQALDALPKENRPVMTAIIGQLQAHQGPAATTAIKVVNQDCYTCKHRGTLPGDAHSTCKQALHEYSNRNADNTVNIRVSLDPHGVRNGWANWPFNFDPIWIESCNSYVNTATEIA